MTKPPIPADEDRRIESLKNLNLLDTPAEDRFDRVTRLVRDALGVDNSAINLVDSDRQWGKSTCGVSRTESDREHSFCAHTILEENAMVIPDARNDERFEDNPFVTGPPYIRYYIGYPIHSPDGQRIGSLCGFDETPRENVEDDCRIIGDLAAIVDAELQRSKLNTSESKLREQLEDAERRAKVDALTSLWNRGAIMDIIETEVNRTNRADLPLAVIMVDIDDFKPFNDQYGHQVGDKVLEVVSEQLRRAIRDYDSVGRYGGEEFIAVCPEVTVDQATEIAERMRSAVEDTVVDARGVELKVTISGGLTVVNPGDDVTKETLIGEADEALYEAKHHGKNTIACFLDNEETTHVQ